MTPLKLFQLWSLCPVYEKAVISSSAKSKADYFLHDPEFRNLSASRLSQAVQIPTWVDDSITDYSKFAKFHEFLESEFKNVFDAASSVYKVNEYGLILEFAGSNSSLKPILFMAHQDTVPLNDPKDWEKDPLSGEYDGENVYGRGSSDCKNLLIGLFETFDALVKDGFLNGKNERTVILSSGFDEENSGFQGAGHLAPFLLEKYGPDSISHIIDEGSSAYVPGSSGGAIGIIATGEKGHFDVEIEVTAPGGHSSVPRDHTSIGYLSQFLSRYEYEQFTPLLTLDNPFLATLQCLAEHTETLPEKVRKNVLKAHQSHKANKKVLEFLKKNLKLRYLAETSQAIDLIKGGDKANSLPQSVTALINHRIAHGNTVQTVWKKVAKYARSVAFENGLGLTVDGVEVLPITENGHIDVRAAEEPLAVAPITPVGDDIWINLASHLRSFYEDLVFPELYSNDTNSVYVPAPGIMTGNTDTKHYWELTNHIFRFEPGVQVDNNIHGLNEFIPLDSHLQVIAFYYQYIQDFDHFY
ncbi:unnamed protein product [Ambrosiozyma monospora]|uniref:Unnamed protein product n=1 Tax=Ambrosiozyma monospora TaxID=43982 RepID=A0ACB5T415_AMBMO|nr:unnamed protein product [Ambrosiozyma monospora]